MKKLWLLVGALVGFVFGSRAGHAPYGRLKAQVRLLAGRPEVKGAVDAAFEKASDPTDAAASQVTAKVSVAAAKKEAGSPTPAVPPHEPTQDPQDKAFGAAASRDQDLVDELEKQGVTAEDLSDKPIRHPRAAGKAEPTSTSGESAKQADENGAQKNRDKDPA